MMRFPLWRRRQQEQLEEEIRSHFETAVADRVARGQDPHAAAIAVRRQFGNPLLVQEVTRDMWGWISLEQLWQDVRYGLRLLLKAPAFTLVAVLTLAIGIGANTAIFSLVNTLLLRPFYPDIQRLVVIEDVPASFRGKNLTFKMSYPKYVAWRQRTDIFESLTAMYGQGPSLTGLGDPERLQAAFVSSDFLPTLGIRPVIGRGFTAEDEPRSAGAVVLLSHRFWRTHFQSSPAVIGRTLRLNDEMFTIVGVLPEGASLGSSLFHSSSAQEFDIVAPLRVQMTDAGANYLVVIGKLRSGLSLAAGMAAIESQTEAINKQLGSTNKGQVIPLQHYLMGETRPLLLLLLGAVAAVLLITCANTANLLLARGASRGKEIAMRLALGARGSRIFRQLLTESLLISLLGGGLALAFLWWTRDGLVALLATRLPNGVAIHINSGVLVFTIVVSLVTGVLFGVAPAWQARKHDLRDSLSQGGRTSTLGSSQRMRNGLVVAEIACTLALCAGAGLLLRSFVRLLQVDKGYSAEHVLTLRFWPGLRYTPESELAYLGSISDRTRQLPGVEAVGFSSNLPLGGNITSGTVAMQGRPVDPDNPIMVSKMLVGGDYFRAIRIPLIAGRVFNERDDAPKAPLVVIVDQTFAGKYLPGENAVGQRINFGWGGSGWCEIVGVVGPVREMSLAKNADPTIYAPFAQRGGVFVHSNVYMAVRSSGDPAQQGQAVTNVIHALNPEQIVEHVRTMNDLIGESVVSSRAPVWLFGGFAIIAMLLAAVGIYGVLSYYVVQRRQEIGTRIALGAQRSDVLRLVLGHAAALIFAGLAAGLAITLATTRALTSLLFGTRPTDPPTLAAVCILLALIGLVACAAPVLRATKVDPLTVLRNE
jgi:predicted permease